MKSKKNLQTNSNEELKQKMASFLKTYHLQPKNLSYYVHAFTHNSYAHEHNLNYNYQRLELLGDSVLQLAVTQYLFFKFFDHAEGSMSQIRTHLIRTSSLEDLSCQLGFDKLVRLGKGAKQRLNQTNRHKLFADIFESFLGALYIDLTFSAVQKFLEVTLFQMAHKNGWLSYEKDPKTILQEVIAQQNNNDPYNLIEYRLLQQQPISKRSGIKEIKFHVQVWIDGKLFATASGQNKQQAEQNAAKICLGKLKTTFD